MTTDRDDPHRYDDIIHLPCPTSLNHPRMSAINRAAQFSPFSALTGYDAVIQETGRYTDERTELDESAKAMLNEKLQMILEHIESHPTVTITCFLPDERKSGGKYVDFTGMVKKIDPFEKAVIFTDKTQIPVDDIYDIYGDIFDRTAIS